MIDKQIILTRHFYADGTIEDIHPFGNEPNFIYKLPANERIKLLVEVAKQYALDAMVKITDKDKALKVYSDSYDKKFTELIIQRCIALCDGNHEHKNHTDTEFGKGVSTGIQLSQEAIKTHFGVEK